VSYEEESDDDYFKPNQQVYYRTIYAENVG